MRTARSFASLPVQVNITWLRSSGKVAVSGTMCSLFIQRAIRMPCQAVTRCGVLVCQATFWLERAKIDAERLDAQAASFDSNARNAARSSAEGTSDCRIVETHGPAVRRYLDTYLGMYRDAVGAVRDAIVQIGQRLAIVEPAVGSEPLARREAEHPRLLGQPVDHQGFQRFGAAAGQRARRIGAGGPHRVFSTKLSSSRFCPAFSKSMSRIITRALSPAP